MEVEIDKEIKTENQEEIKEMEQITAADVNEYNKNTEDYEKDINNQEEIGAALAGNILDAPVDNGPEKPNSDIKASDEEVAFAPVVLDQDETKNKEKLDQLAVDNELQRMVRANETVYKSQLSKLLNYELKFELKGRDPVGINGCVFVPDIIYTVGNRIISPDGVFLITNDIMQCVLTIDSQAIKNEKKITSAGGGSVEITEHGGVIIQTTKT